LALFTTNLPFTIFRKTVCICLLFLAYPLLGQSISGTVIDKATRSPIAYVNIGVVGYNVGVISDEKGRFSIDLGRVPNNEALRFSILGHLPYQIKISSLAASQNNIELEATDYDLPQVQVSADKKITISQLGCKKPSKTTTGQSGYKDFGFGGEWGVLVEKSQNAYQLKDIRFHTRFNAVDSVLFRVNVYSVINGQPGKPLLGEELYVMSYDGDKWITTASIDKKVIINEDIIVSIEFIRRWLSDKGDNHFFYTHCKTGLDEATTFHRDSSFDEWKVNQKPTLAIALSGYPVKE